MSWFNVWDGLKNKTCRYLLQRYLGQFLEEKLNLEQLNVELYNGKATVKNVSLKVDVSTYLCQFVTRFYKFSYPFLKKEVAIRTPLVMRL